MEAIKEPDTEETVDTTVPSIELKPEETITTTSSIVEEDITTVEPIVSTSTESEKVTEEVDIVTTEQPDLIVDTTLPTTQEIKKCIRDGVEYENLSDVPDVDPCKLCQCDDGEIICAQQTCAGPPENYENCVPIVEEGECCPKYECDDNTNTRLDEGDYEITTVREPKPLESDEIVPKVGTEKDEVPKEPVEDNEILDDDSEYIVDDGCYENDVYYNNFDSVPHSNPCKVCFCDSGKIICADRECLVPKGFENCVPLPTTNCCPEQFECCKYMLGKFCTKLKL